MADERVGRIAAYKFFDARQEAEERSTFGVVSVDLQPVPVSVYPLDDDGTVAASFGFSPFVMMSPDYERGTYVYTDAASNGIALATPDTSDIFGNAAISTVGRTIACEFLIESVPISSFDGIAMLVIPSTGGMPSFAGILGIGVIDSDGISPQWLVVGGSDIARAISANNARVGIEIDGNTGTLVLRTSDGSALTFPSFWATGFDATFVVQIRDSGSPPNTGNTATVRIIPSASNMTLSYSAGAVDLFGVII